MRGKNNPAKASAGLVNAVRGGLRAARREDRKSAEPSGVQLQGIVRFKVAARVLSCTTTQLRNYVALGWLEAWRPPGGQRSTGIFTESLERFLDEGRKRAAAVRQAEAGTDKAAG